MRNKKNDFNNAYNLSLLVLNFLFNAYNYAISDFWFWK